MTAAPIKSQTRKIAHHEAGHAVVARALGVGVAYVTMFSTDSKARACVYTESAAHAARSSERVTLAKGFEVDAIVKLAGPHAQNRYQKRSGIICRPLKEWESDFEDARMMLGIAIIINTDPTFDTTSYNGPSIKLSEDQREQFYALYNHVLREANRLVTEHWSAIERVAEHLLTHPITTEADIDVIIAERG